MLEVLGGIFYLWAVVSWNLFWIFGWRERRESVQVLKGCFTDPVGCVFCELSRNTFPFWACKTHPVSCVFFFLSAYINFQNCGNEFIFLWSFLVYFSNEWCLIDSAHVHTYRRCFICCFWCNSKVSRMGEEKNPSPVCYQWHVGWSWITSEAYKECASWAMSKHWSVVLWDWER